VSDNLKIWNEVCETDPSHTKHVGQRGGFTAIDAHYQVQRATEVFGAVGKGWRYVTEYSETHFQNGAAVVNCDLRFAWGDNGKELPSNMFGPIRGCSVLCNADGRIDPDAPKKAMTDALTKALSHLGFNADVFLGKFDDNKYVEQQRAKYSQMPEKRAKEIASLLEAANPETGEGCEAFAEAWVEMNSDEQRSFGPWFSKFYPGAVTANKQHMRDVLDVWRKGNNGASE